MKRRLFFFPQYKAGMATNPYCDDYISSLRKKIEVVGFSSLPLPRSIQFFLGAFKADVYIVNWLESVVFLRFSILQFIFAYLGLVVIKIRRKRIVWMFHNIKPHEGNTLLSKILQNHLHKNASLIVAHSKEAEAYARGLGDDKVVYYCHPINNKEYTPSIKVEECAIFIWGKILPYKGVLEFIKNEATIESNCKIVIIGSCNDPELDRQIKESTNENIIYENRRASYDEIAAYCRSAKIVLFPYIGECVSSSGALIDTLVMGGIPIGPNKGAFRDLKEEGCCVTYEDIREVFSLIENKNPLIDAIKQREFCMKNSWDTFTDNILKELNILNSNQ